MQFIEGIQEGRRRELLQKVLETEASIIAKALESEADIYSHLPYFAEKIMDSFSDDLIVKLMTQDKDIVLTEVLRKRSLRSTTNPELVFLRVLMYNDWNASFIFRDEGRYLKFHSKTIFVRCSDALFDQYYEYLQKHRRHIKDP